MEWYVTVLRKYADFSGRARRKEYWMFALMNAIVCWALIGIDNILGLTIGELFYGPLYIVYALGVLIPGLAVLVRRLHDVGKSGAFVFIAFIPCVGPIWLFVLLVTDSAPGSNEYGPNPKEPELYGQDPFTSNPVSGSYCTQCGTPISATDRFCTKCGAKFN